MHSTIIPTSDVDSSGVFVSKEFVFNGHSFIRKSNKPQWPTFHRWTLVGFRITLSFSDDSPNNSTIFIFSDILAMKLKQLNLQQTQKDWNYTVTSHYDDQSVEGI